MEMETINIEPDECDKLENIIYEELAIGEKMDLDKWSNQKIIEGKKVCEIRERKYLDDPRVDWITPKLPYSFIKEYLYFAEGANSPEELKDILEKRFSKDICEDDRFFVHFAKFNGK